MADINIYETINAIKEKINDLTAKEKEIGNSTISMEGRKLWTWFIQNAFIELAYYASYYVNTSIDAESRKTLPPDQQETVKWGEWLYDLVWYTETRFGISDTYHTTSVPLVMECEWGNTIADIAIDFDKLLVANANLRVLVCGAYKNFPAKDIIAYCEAAVRGYQQGRVGDCFLLCITDEIEDTVFHTIVKIQ